MLRLFRNSSGSDWKGRPSAHLTDLGTGTREELINRMNQDVLVWQKEDLDIDRKIAKEEGEEPPAEDVQWEVSNERWEMNRNEWKTDHSLQTLREFAWVYEGENTSIVYHILDIL
jgi:hypothetical protein